MSVFNCRHIDSSANGQFRQWTQCAVQHRCLVLGDHVRCVTWLSQSRRDDDLSGAITTSMPILVHHQLARTFDRIRSRTSRRSVPTIVELRIGNNGVSLSHDFQIRVNMEHVLRRRHRSVSQRFPKLNGFFRGRVHRFVNEQGRQGDRIDASFRLVTWPEVRMAVAHSFLSQGQRATSASKVHSRDDWLRQVLFVNSRGVISSICMPRWR